MTHKCAGKCSRERIQHRCAGRSRMTIGVCKIYSGDGIAAELSTTAANVVPFDSFGPLTSPTMRSFHSHGTHLVPEHFCDGKSVPPRSRRAWCESGTSLSQVYETLRTGVYAGPKPLTDAETLSSVTRCCAACPTRPRRTRRAVHAGGVLAGACWDGGESHRCPNSRVAPGDRGRSRRAHSPGPHRSRRRLRRSRLRFRGWPEENGSPASDRRRAVARAYPHRRPGRGGYVSIPTAGVGSCVSTVLRLTSSAPQLIYTLDPPCRRHSQVHPVE
jgi:hypothetical protein